LTTEQIDSHYIKGVLGNPGGPPPADAWSNPAGISGQSGTTQAGRTAGASDMSYSDVVLTDHPGSYWRLGEQSGATAADSSGGDHSGTYTDAVTLGHPGAPAGDPDTSVELTGGYVAVPDSAAVSMTGALTVEAWVNPKDVCQQYAVVEKYDTPANNGYAVRMSPGGRLSALTLAHDGSLAVVNGSSVVTPHEWHHVVAVYDGTTISVYLDGRLDGSAVTTVAPTDGAASLKLGARGDDAGTRLSGMLDEVAIYDHALTADQVARHYTAGTTGGTKLVGS
jgi:hypothetical protein